VRSNPLGYDVYVTYTYDSCDPCTFWYPGQRNGYEMRSHDKDHYCGTFGTAAGEGRHVTWRDLVNCVNSALR
jgi:hypothetical protein